MSGVEFVREQVKKREVPSPLAPPPSSATARVSGGPVLPVETATAVETAQPVPTWTYESDAGTTAVVVESAEEADRLLEALGSWADGQWPKGPVQVRPVPLSPRQRVLAGLVDYARDHGAERARVFCESAAEMLSVAHCDRQSAVDFIQEVVRACSDA